MSEVRKFPRQPVLSQILDVIPGYVIRAANRKHKAQHVRHTLHFSMKMVAERYDGSHDDAVACYNTPE